jgi:acyl-CoA reductase-like NAD-dependent aldehyde dehydrogenase
MWHSRDLRQRLGGFHRGVKPRGIAFPFGGINDSGNGYKEGVIEAMKSYTNLKTFSLPW